MVGPHVLNARVVCEKTQLFLKRRVAWCRISASFAMTQLVKDAVCWLPLASSVRITSSKSKIQTEIRFQGTGFNREASLSAWNKPQRPPNNINHISRITLPPPLLSVSRVCWPKVNTKNGSIIPRGSKSVCGWIDSKPWRRAILSA